MYRKRGDSSNPQKKNKSPNFLVTLNTHQNETRNQKNTSSVNEEANWVGGGGGFLNRIFLHVCSCVLCARLVVSDEMGFLLLAGADRSPARYFAEG
jgi:hypothetical protein